MHVCLYACWVGVVCCGMYILVCRFWYISPRKDTYQISQMSILSQGLWPSHLSHRIVSLRPLHRFRFVRRLGDVLLLLGRWFDNLNWKQKNERNDQYQKNISDILTRFEFAIMNSSCSGVARISIQTGEKTRHTHHQFTAKLCWGSLESWISSSNRRNLRIVASVKQTNLKPISNPVYLMVAKTPYFEHRRAATVVMHCPWQNKEQTCVTNAMVPFHCQNHHHHLLARQHKQVSASSPRPYRGTSGCQTTP